MGGVFSKPKMPAMPAPAPVVPTPTVDQSRMDQDRADIMRRRRGRAATVLAGKDGGGSDLPAGAVAAKSLLGQ